MARVLKELAIATIATIGASAIGAAIGATVWCVVYC